MDLRQAVQSAMAAAAGEQPPEADVPPHFHWLLRLPARFWSEMHHYLDYTEILGLARLSSQFRSMRLEEFLPWTVRHAFVARLESQLRGQNEYACYLCFRIRDIDEFPKAQKADDLATHARVVQRDWYRGRRIFERVPPPSPGQQFAVVAPPSPVGTRGLYYFARSSALPSMEVGMPATINTGMMAMGSAVGGSTAPGPLLPLQIPVSATMMVQRSHGWRPRAPGAPVGKIESLRRYCIECAIETHLLAPGDMVTMRGEPMWLCHCRIPHRSSDNVPCAVCGMNPVIRV